MCFNREGDLLFTCSKDHSPAVWKAETGERIGTYDGHIGAIWSCDPTRDSKLLLTGSGDMTAKLWAAHSGLELFTFRQPGACKSVAWAEGDREFATCCDPFGMTQGACINIYSFADKKEDQSDQPRLTITLEEAPRSRISRIGWLPLNVGLLAAYDTGDLRIWDPKTGKLLRTIKAHDDNISFFTFNADKTLLLTSSADQSAKLWDMETFNLIKTYEADGPLNTCGFSPVKEHVFLAGGQEAVKVTTTNATAGKFETRVWHMIFAKELGLIKGHFGPVNTLAVHPGGRLYASGGEDGFVRIFKLDQDYDSLDAEFQVLDDPRLRKMHDNNDLPMLEEEEKEEREKTARMEAAAAAASSTGSGAAPVVASSAAPAVNKWQTGALKH